VGRSGGVYGLDRLVGDVDRHLGGAVAPEPVRSLSSGLGLAAG